MICFGDASGLCANSRAMEALPWRGGWGFGRVMACLIVGRPWGQFQGWSIVLKKETNAGVTDQHDWGTTSRSLPLAVGWNIAAFFNGVSSRVQGGRGDK